ncbi:MAG: DUF1824 family protein [Hormoscilla sp.]
MHQNQNQLTEATVAAALKLLKLFSCTETKSVDSEAEKTRLREALLLIVNLSDSQNLGICADNPAQAFDALASYLEALGYKMPPGERPSHSNPVYLKFNSQKMSYYLDDYTGKYRGVLVSCQSSESEELNGTYGHLPLDLFAQTD